MLQNRRRRRIASIIIGSMGGSPSSAKEYSHNSESTHDSNSHGMDMMPKSYYEKEGSHDEGMKKPGYEGMKKPEYEGKMDMGKEALEMACGTMLAAIRADDVGLLCRAFKAAYKACEQYEGKMAGNSHGSHGGY